MGCLDTAAQWTRDSAGVLADEAGQLEIERWAKKIPDPFGFF